MIWPDGPIEVSSDGHPESNTPIPAKVGSDQYRPPLADEGAGFRYRKAF